MPNPVPTWNLNGPLLLVGCGKMGGAMLAGWLASGLSPAMVRVSDPGISPPLDEWCRLNGIRPNEEIGQPTPSVIIMAVKPQVMDAVFRTIMSHASRETLILSIAAGKTLASFEQHLPANSAVVRAMPNTPAAIGRGMTVLCGKVSDNQKALCERLMSAVGETGWVDDENLMDAVTAVSGSGPAYVFLLAEAMTQAGINAGLAPALATQLARATIAGSGELLRQSAEIPAATLRQNVTSPGGTTAAALDVLMADDGLTPLIDRAIAAATARGKALAK